MESIVQNAYANQRKWDGEQRQMQSNLASNQREAQITKARDTARAHSNDGKHVAAYHEYLALAENYQDTESQYQVALMLKEGRGVKRNVEQAFFWMNKAALQGDKCAHFEVGRMYALGIGVEKNYASAIMHFKSAAAETGIHEAYFELGKLFGLGYGQASDYADYGCKTYFDAAEHCLKNAVRCGVIEAEQELVRLHYYGYGANQDIQLASMYSRQVTTRKSENDAPVTDTRVHSWDYVVAVGYYDKAHAQGLPRSKNHDAPYSNEYGVNYAPLHQFYNERAQQNDACALFNLGMMHLKGLGVDKDLMMALKYLVRAAQSYNVDAKLQLITLLNGGESSDVIQCYKFAATNKEIWALLELGRIYALGSGKVEKNCTKALAYFKDTANLGSPRALVELGMLFALGYGQQSDYGDQTNYQAAVACFEKVIGLPEVETDTKEVADAKKEAKAQAQCALGRMYLYGNGVVEDAEVAWKYIQMAADQGVPEAMVLIGLYNKDEDYAIHMLESAADLGSVEAMDLLSVKYAEVDDYSAALKYCKQSVVLEYSCSVHNLGCMYENGYGVDTNLAIAVEYYRISAAMGEGGSLFTLGGIYFEGGEGVIEDYSAAFDYTRRAAELGVGNAWELLAAIGECIKDTDNLRNYKAARAYYEEAHQQGLPTFDELARYEYGYDYSQVHNFYLKRAENNDPRAFYNLGMLHLEGRGVDKNLARALEYLGKAMQLHDPEAKYQLTKLLSNKGDVKASDVVLCYQREADKKQPWALLGLGRLYALGLGVEMNHAKAIACFKEAAALGNPYAWCELAKMFVLGYGPDSDYAGLTNYALAEACFKWAIHWGVAEAELELGKIYLFGNDVDKSEEEAYKHINIAAQKGVPEAVFYCSDEYREGRYDFDIKYESDRNSNEYGMDFSKEYRLYREEAKKKIPHAFYNLGLLYLEGKGVERNLPQALEYLEQKSTPEAMQKIEKLLERSTDDMQQQVLACYEEAAKKNKTWALLRMGILYVEGAHVEQDRLRGWGYLEELVNLKVSLEIKGTLSPEDNLRGVVAERMLARAKANSIKSNFVEEKLLRNLDHHNEL